jgi:hypothetical protein
MTRHWIALALGCAAWLPATAALAIGEPPRVVMKPAPTEPAADGPATPVAPVTVEATKPAELRKQTYSFVQFYAATTQNLDQLARWDIPVCVTVQGLPAEANAQVRGRVEEVARALKVPVRGTGCGPNIQILFTNQPQALLDKVAAEHEHLLGYWHHRDRDKLKTVTRPVQAWYVTATNGSGGPTGGQTFATIIQSGTAESPQNTAVPEGAAGREPGGEAYDDEFTNRMPTGCADRPHFTSCLQSVFRHVLVVVDTSKVQDQSPGAIADYAAMLAMAQPKSLDACNTLPSVIDLLASRCPGAEAAKDGLTRADVAYLTALYRTDLEAKKAGQQTDIANKMADMLLRANATDRLEIFGGAVKASNGR